MRFLQLVIARAEHAAPQSPEQRAEAMKAIKQKIDSGKLIATGGLGKRATEAARVSMQNGEVSVEDPPSGDGWMAAGGYSLIEAATKEEAIAEAKSTLSRMGGGVIELIAVSEMHPPAARAPQSGGQAGPGSGVIPYLNIAGASEAAAFYAKAFGAREIARMPAEDGKRLMHCQLEINGGAFMMADQFPEMGGSTERPAAVTMQLIVSGVDRWWQRAVDAGCSVKMPLELMFWGDKYGQLQDPFGVTWALSEPGAGSK